METGCVSCEVRTEFLNSIQVKFRLRFGDAGGERELEQFHWLLYSHLPAVLWFHPRSCYVMENHGRFLLLYFCSTSLATRHSIPALLAFFCSRRTNRTVFLQTVLLKDSEYPTAMDRSVRICMVSFRHSLGLRISITLPAASHFLIDKDKMIHLFTYPTCRAGNTPSPLQSPTG
jgi:hypothetical protein